MQTREGVLDLTLEAFREGGPAFELAPAVARVMAEAAEALDREATGADMGGGADVADVHGRSDPSRR